VTSTGFAAGLGNYVVVAVTLKTVGGSVDPMTGVSYGGTALSPVASHVIDDGLFDIYTYIYAGTATVASGDVVVDYAYIGSGDPWDSVTICASSWAGAGGFSAATGAGGSTGNDGPISAPITTTQDGSVIISSVGVGYGALTGWASDAGTIQMNEYTTDGTVRTYGLLISEDAATAGAYTPDVTWTESTARRSVIVSVELLKSSESATAFVIR